MRYLLLDAHGGVYLDCDTQPLMSIEPLCKGHEFWVGWESQDTWIGNAYIGSIPRHPFLTYLISMLPRSVAEHRGKARANVISGPQFVTKCWKTFQRMETVQVYPQQHLYPYSFNELHRGDEDFAGAYAVHHWNNARNKYGLWDAE